MVLAAKQGQEKALQNIAKKPETIARRLEQWLNSYNQ